MMERRVKERLIGATVLVVLIVLIVPEMLSGPRRPSAPPLTDGMPAATRSVSVDLSTSSATAEPDPTDGASVVQPSPGASAPGVLASDAAPESSTAPEGSAAAESARRPGAGEKSGDAPSAPSVTTLRAQQSAEPPLERPPPTPRSEVGGSRSEGGSPGHRAWSVQLGSFASRANAEKLVHQLQAHGGSSLYISTSGSGASLRYRVRVGPLADRSAAERTAGKLRAAGHPATVVAPAA